MLDQKPTHQESLTGTHVGQERPIALLCVAVCLIGALVVSFVAWTGMSLIGVFIIAYGAAILDTKKQAKLAVVAVVAGAAISLFQGIPVAAMVLFLGLITLQTTRFVGRRLGQARFFLMVGAFTVAVFAVDAIDTYVAGLTIYGEIEATTSALIKALTIDGALPAETIAAVQSAVSTIAMLWPSMYFIEGVMCAALVVISARVAYSRHGARNDQPLFDKTDLTVHIVWILIAGLLCWAATYLSFDYTQIAKVVGLNLLVCSVVLFMIQGFAVISFWMNKARLNKVLHVLIYLVAIQMEVMFLIPSFIGLIDIWANFRKLPRDGATMDPADGESTSKG